MIVSDLVAKASMLNMFQFNAIAFGCHVCTIKGNTIDGTNYFPSDQQFELRDKEFHRRMSALAESMNVGRPKAQCHNISGYKGVSAFENIVDGLPLSAGVDHMHSILLVVFPNLFKMLKKSETRKIHIVETEPVAFRKDVSDLDDMNAEIEALKPSREIVKHGRGFRNLNEIAHF